MPMTGGYSDAKTDVETVTSMIKAQNGLFDQLLEKIGATKDHTVNITEYKTQTVAGMNYKVTAKNESNGKSHEVTLFKPLPHTNESIAITDVNAL